MANRINDFRLMLFGLVLALPHPALAKDTAEDTRFKAIYTAEWAWRARELPDDTDADGPPSPHLPDVSPAAQARRLAHWQQVSAALDHIAPARLNPTARENYAVYRYQIATLIAQQRARDYEMPANADSSFWADLASSADKTLHTEAEYRAYLARLSEMPRYFAQQIANMRAGEARGFTPPRVTLAGRDASVERVIDTTKPNPFYAPFIHMPATIPADQRAALRAEAVQTINHAVLPAHRVLLVFLDEDYIPHARDSLAAADLPDGRAYYQAKIREYTTLDLTAQQIHEIGLAQMALIHTRMEQTMREAHFTGDLPAFLAFLRHDPQFYVTTPQALLDRAAWIAKSFDGKAADWFGHLPRRRFGIVPVPDSIAPYYTAGRGGPGVYLVNTYDLPARPLYALPALTLHESAPGHAFQIPLAAENTALPPFRQQSYISAYGEGWALYCETLGEEMGLYQTPYERFGMLSYQAWRAARLVVDTGIHTQGWSREQARQYLHDNTALSDREIATETDRYISWPGQALSYYLGEMAILEARHKAEAALGTRFNIRAFHDTVLQLGSVPLPVLTARIDRFIAEGGKGPYPAEE